MYIGESDSALCSFEWNDWLDDQEFWDMPAFETDGHMYIVILHDMTVMIEKDYWMLLLSN